jgi:hypothetical protein
LVRDRNGPERPVHFFLAANHDSDDGREPLANNLQKGCAVHFRHANIGNNHVERLFRQEIERRISARRECSFPLKLLRFERASEPFEKFLFIVNKEDSFHSRLPFPKLYLAHEVDGYGCEKRISTRKSSGER